MALGSGDNDAFNYDTGMRLTSASLTRASDSTLLFQTQPTYDAANNVVGVATSISGQTDTQQFCYDALNRLTWSATSGIPHLREDGSLTISTIFYLENLVVQMS